MEQSSGIEEKIYNTFSGVARFLGYNEVHGRIVATLLIKGKPVSLQELSTSTKYSISSISISLDMLDLMGVIKKTKNVGDRNLYVSLAGDILVGLRTALILKFQNEIDVSLAKFDEYKNDDMDHIKKELLRLKQYIYNLSQVEIPKS